MTLSEREWFDKVPKSVLFEIARQFGMRVADDFTAEAAFAAMVNEWELLHVNGIVPQKPAKARSERDIVVSWLKRNPNSKIARDRLAEIDART